MNIDVEPFSDIASQCLFNVDHHDVLHAPVTSAKVFAFLIFSARYDIAFLQGRAEFTIQCRN